MSIRVDTSQRIEDIIARLKLDKKGQYFYVKGREVPMNSSLASHNVQDGDILESCPCPKFSAILSAVMRDLKAVVDKIGPSVARTEAKVRPLLDGASLDPWPDRWNDKVITSRIICLATMKEIIQRGGRFANIPPPACETLEELMEFMNTVWRGDTRPYNSNAFIVSKTNKDGRPTTCWELLQNKLAKLEHFTTSVGQDVDPLETFIQADCARHNKSSMPNSARRASALSTATGRTGRVLRMETSASKNSRNMRCSSCQQANVECLCLDAQCPFYKIMTCAGCFLGNHPILQRNHERVSVKDPRARPVAREQARPQYIPEYSSGAFAILATLFEASEGHLRGTREFSLVESRLKKLAQRRCRSNLYDHQARNRTAFACVETLVDKGLVRKELIPGSEESKFSLLVPGEELGSYCYHYEQALLQEIQTQPMKDEREVVLRRMSSPVELIIDKREDASFAERLVERSREVHLATEQQDLPAGDYLFTMRSANERLVLPLVIERKSWSDLADSVLGSGRSRLECVRLDRASDGPVCTGSCQLCRMKRTGFSKIMFIIEGARCLGRDHENKCDDQKRCQYCREIMERHGSTVRHKELEGVLQELQVKHGCIIHFTRGYNETIDSLLHIKEIMSRYQDDAATLVSYAQFCSNVRSRSSPSSPSIVRGKSSHLAAEDLITSMKKGIFLKYVSGQLAHLPNQPQPLTASPQSLREIVVVDDDLLLSQSSNSPSIRQAFGHIALEIEIDESDQETRVAPAREELGDEVPIVSQQQGVTAQKKRRAPIVYLASESDDDIEVTASTTKRPPAHRNQGENDDVIVLETLPTSVVRTFTTRSTSRKRKRQQVRPPPSQQGDNAVPLLLVRGMYEYDKEYWDDVNKLWRCAYSSFPKDGVERFAAFASKQLSASGISDEDNLPLIPRDTFLFWVLYVQLTMNVRLLLTRSNAEMQSIQRAWDGSLPLLRQEVASLRAVATTTARRSLDFAMLVQECMICKAPVTDGTAVTTPCKHTFHVHCLTVVVSGSRTRKCPHCNFQGIGLPKSPAINSTKTPITQSSSGRPSHAAGRPPPAQVTSKPNKTKSSAEAVREARLRRFGGGSSTIPSDNHAAAIDDRFWTCGHCTFAENAITFTSCSVCDVPRDSTEVSFWECESCTLRNTRDIDQCSACSAVNPFKVSAPNFPSVELDGFSGLHPLPSPIHARSESWTTERTLASASSEKKVTCGACGLPGHNRSTATASSCRAYNTPAERERRAKKKDEAKIKAREKREEAARYEELSRSQINQATRQEQEVRRLLEASARQNEQLRELSEKEASRKKKAADRAEKRARRLSG